CLLSPSLSSQPSDSLRHLHAFPPRRSSDLGFAMTILSAAIKAIPDDIVEAARLDGLKGFGMFRYITIPSVRPALVVVLTTIAMATLKIFDIVRTMTGGQFGTQVVANEFYTQAFRQNNQGLSSAL